MSTSRLDDVVSGAVESGAAPFVVAMVAGRDCILWQGSAGPATAKRDADPDTTVLSLYSATKAIGSLMAIIAIDRGLVTMDTPVGDIIPKFDDLKVLVEMGPGGPVFREPKTRATLRHLLTHTSGMGYEAFYPLQAEYQRRTGAPTDEAGTYESLYYPLLFDPGEGFAYGVGTDWVGAVVAELDGRSVDRFVIEEILQPLDMTSTYFERAEAGDRLADLMWRHPDGRFERILRYPPSHPELYHMGHALYSTAADYTTFLQLVLNRGEHRGHRIVGAEAMELMHTNQAPGLTLPTPLLKSSVDAILDSEPCPGTRKSHTAAFLRNEDELPGMRSAGSLSWCGLHNTHYWIDPRRGLSAVFMSQVEPLFEPGFMAYFDEFERAVCREFG